MICLSLAGYLYLLVIWIFSLMYIINSGILNHYPFKYLFYPILCLLFSFLNSNCTFVRSFYFVLQFCFYFLLSLLFLSFSWDIFKVTHSLLSSVKFANETANDNLDLYSCFSLVASSFNFFLMVPISLLKLLIWQWVMSNFYVWDFDIFLIVISNSLSDSSNICALYKSGSVDYCGVLSITLSCIPHPMIFFFYREDREEESGKGSLAFLQQLLIPSPKPVPWGSFLKTLPSLLVSAHWQRAKPVNVVNSPSIGSL